MTPIDHEVLDAQRQHWQDTFQANAAMFGVNASQPARYAIELFTSNNVVEILELGSGQGRDTIAFLKSGLTVNALDYATDALTELTQAATDATLEERLKTFPHDIRKPLPFPNESVDAVYSHMLFNMALTTTEITLLGEEVLRILRPGGWHIYTARHIGDSHFNSGIPRGENMSEHGGFIVQFFNRGLVDQLSVGFTTPELVAFEEGSLPRKLWRVTQRKIAKSNDEHTIEPNQTRGRGTTA